MTDRSPLSSLARMAPTGILFLVFMLIVGALLLISGPATQSSSYRATSIPTATAIIVPTAG